ncbi:hypothetical protein R84B8_01953 [Treponema sp. R8-4-B8]
MKKLIFIVMMLVAVNFVFSDPADDAIDSEAKSIVQQNEDFYQEFQQKYKTLKAYDTSKQSKDALKQMQEMIARYKRLVDAKIEEIDGIEKTGRTVPVAEFDQLRSLIARYHQMTLDLANWINTKK